VSPCSLCFCAWCLSFLCGPFCNDALNRDPNRFVCIILSLEFFQVYTGTGDHTIDFDLEVKCCGIKLCSRLSFTLASLVLKNLLCSYIFLLTCFNHTCLIQNVSHSNYCISHNCSPSTQLCKENRRHDVGRFYWYVWQYTYQKPGATTYQRNTVYASDNRYVTYVTVKPCFQCFCYQ